MMNMSASDIQSHNQMYEQNSLEQQQQQQQHPHDHSQHNMQTFDINQEKHEHIMEERHEDEDGDYHDNKSETSTRSGEGSGKSKVFQCTGYGECNMVFTRSEHLARHMRKHTGEKPFKCVVPGCERMFSRFDNMMQHTQTHNKVRGGPKRLKTKSTNSKRGGKKVSSQSSRAGSYDEYKDYALPSPPPSRRGSSLAISAIKEHQIILPNPKYVETDEDDEDEDERDEAENEIIRQRSRFYFSGGNNNKLPPYRYPDSPVSSDSLSSYTGNNSSSHNSDFFPRRRSAPQVRYQPYPQTKQCHKEALPTVLRRHSSALSQLVTYLVNNPDQEPDTYLMHRSQSTPIKLGMTRRLSIQDLSNPIESLNDFKQVDTKEVEGVDLTQDEYEAIQGFGQFYRAAASSVAVCNNK